jgi:hypothetical protein
MDTTEGSSKRREHDRAVLVLALTLAMSIVLVYLRVEILDALSVAVTVSDLVVQALWRKEPQK